MARGSIRRGLALAAAGGGLIWTAAGLTPQALAQTTTGQTTTGQTTAGQTTQAGPAQKKITPTGTSQTGTTQTGTGQAAPSGTTPSTTPTTTTTTTTTSGQSVPADQTATDQTATGQATDQATTDQAVPDQTAMDSAAAQAAAAAAGTVPGGAGTVSAFAVPASWAGATLPPGAGGLVQTTQGPQVPPRLAFSLQTGVNLDSNRDLTIGPHQGAATFDTTLGLAYAARTRTQSFSASLSGLLRFGKVGSGGSTVSGTGLQQPAAQAAYSFDNGDTLLSLSGVYRRSQVNQFQPLQLANGGYSASDLVATTGSVISWGAKAALETGRREALGVIASASIDRRQYGNTAPGSLNNDTRAVQASGGLRFHIDPLSQLDATLGFSRTTTADALDTRQEQRRIGFAYTRQLTATLKATAQLGYSRNRTDQLLFGFLPASRVNNGLYGGLDLQQALANGGASLSLTSSRDSYGPQTTIEAGRSLTLPAGSLAAQLGVTSRPGQGAQAIGSLAWALKGPADSLQLSAGRSVTLDSTNTEVAYLSVGLDYSHQLSPLSSLALSARASHTSPGGLGTATTVDRQDLSATFSYDLTRDWSLNAGYLFRHLNEPGTGTATSNSVFLNVGRKFVLIP